MLLFFVVKPKNGFLRVFVSVFYLASFSERRRNSNFRFYIKNKYIVTCSLGWVFQNWSRNQNRTSTAKVMTSSPCQTDEQSSCSQLNHGQLIFYHFFVSKFTRAASVFYLPKSTKLLICPQACLLVGYSFLQGQRWRPHKISKVNTTEHTILQL